MITIVLAHRAERKLFNKEVELLRRHGISVTAYGDHNTDIDESALVKRMDLALEALGARIATTVSKGLSSKRLKVLGDTPATQIARLGTDSMPCLPYKPAIFGGGECPGSQNLLMPRAPSAVDGAKIPAFR